MQVRWGQGATEGGSSGSPLIDADTSRVVGVLTGGFSSCSQPNAPDYYGRLSAVGPLSRSDRARCSCTADGRLSGFPDEPAICERPLQFNGVSRSITLLSLHPTPNILHKSEPATCRPASARGLKHSLYISHLSPALAARTPRSLAADQRNRACTAGRRGWAGWSAVSAPTSRWRWWWAYTSQYPALFCCMPSRLVAVPPTCRAGRWIAGWQFGCSTATDCSLTSPQPNKRPRC